MVSSSTTERADVAVVGAGAAGLAATLALTRAGLRAISFGRPDRGGAGRTVALFGPSQDFLQELGVWPQIEGESAALRTLRIVDDTGSPFAARPVDFRAAEIGREAFGRNIENAQLVAILETALPAGVRRETDVASFDFAPDSARLTLADGGACEARLVIGADGRNSPSRKAADIDLRARPLGQIAIAALLRHSRPHGDASTEFHTREGPFTLVPLPAAPGAPHRSSLVWLMRPANAERMRALDDQAFAQEVWRRSRALLGDIAVEGGRGELPMILQRAASLTAPRLALVGDAAHAFPPIGAQGLNLGLRDVAQIARLAAANADPGGPDTLQAYAAARRADIGVRSLGVAMLNQSLLSRSPLVDIARAAGLTALGAFSPLRRLAMREGVSPALAR